AFNCRNCGGQVNLLAPGQSLSAACNHCGAVADLTDDNFRILSDVKAKITRTPLFEIGSKAQFEGKTWVFIGFMVREVEKYQFVWEEYLLFNPYYGFRFLANAYGHWSWIKMIQDLQRAQYHRPEPMYQGESFRQFSTGSACVRYVLGEFYWKAKVDDLAATVDYISPPYMLSREIEDGGMIWSLGEYLEPQVVADAFGVDRSILPRKVGVGANQPNQPIQDYRRILPFWLGSILAVFIIGFISSTSAPKVLAWSQTYRFPIVNDTVSGIFTLPEGMNRNLEVQVKALSGLENHWVEYAGVLHDTLTNLNYDFIIPVEYYQGVTNGESWSEGSIGGNIVLNEIPGGTYEMVSSIASDSTGDVEIKIFRGVPIYSNWIWPLLILSIVPIFLFFRGKSMERRRNAE
ncbi:MAG: hypothetical protein RLZZ165_1848, partial [Bacteroidota bacterium]